MLLQVPANYDRADFKQNRITPWLPPLLIVAAVCLSFFYQGGSHYHFFSICIWLVLLAVVAHYLVSKESFHHYSTPEFWLVLFTLWATLSVTWSNNLTTTLLTLPLFLVFLFTLILSKRTTPRTQEMVVILITALLSLNALYSLYQYYSSPITLPAGLMHNPNINATLLNFALLPLCAGFLLAPKSRPHRQITTLLLIALLFSVSAIIYSRGALLGFSLGLLLILSHRNIVIFSSKTLILFTTIAIIFFSAYHLKRDGSNPNITKSLSATSLHELSSGRSRIWTTSYEMLLQHPVIGSGVGSFWPNYQALRPSRDRSSGQYVHNDYLQFLLELGVVGFLLFLLFLVTAAQHIAKSITAALPDATSWHRTGVTAAALSVLLHSIFTFNLYVLTPLMLAAMYLGFTLSQSAPASPILSARLNNLAVFVFFLLSLAFSLSLYFSDQTLKKLDSISTAKEAMTLLQKASEFYPYRDVTDLLYAQQVLSAIREDPTLASDEKVINFAIAKLQHGLRMFPQRWENPYYQAELMRAVTGRFSSDEIVDLYTRSLAMKPSYLPARIRLASYYEEHHHPDLALATLESGWGRYYYEDSQSLLQYLEMLIELRRSHEGRINIDDIERVHRYIRTRMTELHVIKDSLILE